MGIDLEDEYSPKPGFFPLNLKKVKLSCSEKELLDVDSFILSNIQ